MPPFLGDGNEGVTLLIHLHHLCAPGTANWLWTPSITGEIKEPEQGVISTETPNTEIPKALDYLAGNTRQDGELYCDYKCRLFWEKQLHKRYLKGKSIWIGRDRGEIRNMDRLTRTSRKSRKVDARKELRSEQGKLAPEDVRCWNRKRKRQFIEACDK